MIDLNKLLELESKANDPDIVNPCWGYYNENTEYVELNGHVITLLRDGILRKEFRHFQYAVACMNSVPILIAELKAARDVVNQAMIDSKDHPPSEPMSRMLDRYTVVTNGQG